MTTGDVPPIFDWSGLGQRQGSHIHYKSFTFSGEPYALGDFVYLLPEDVGSPPYIAKLLRAYEDTKASEAEKLVIEVQWFERRAALPPAVASTMHELEVVESDLTDANLVGCLERKATVVLASSYSEALQQVPVHQRSRDWHFCKGVLESATQRVKTYQELGRLCGTSSQGAVSFRSGSVPVTTGIAAEMQVLGYTNGPISSASRHQAAADAPAGLVSTSSSADDIPTLTAGSIKGSASRGRGAAGNAGFGQRVGVPGKVCCECGATQTPQWREGPQGPKTLCNACGVRYQRSMSKNKSNKRAAADRARKECSPLQPRAAKQVRLTAATVVAAGAGDNAGSKCVQANTKAGSEPTSSETPEQQLTAGGHSHGTRSSTGARGQQGASSKTSTSRVSASSGRRRQQLRGAAASNKVVTILEQQVQRGGGGSSGKAAGNRSTAKGGATGGSSGISSRQHLGAAVAAAAALSEHHYFEGASSPPNLNTHMLEEQDDDGDGQQHGNGQQGPFVAHSLHRSATHDAADVLRALSTAPQIPPSTQHEQATQTLDLQQQQPVQQQHASTQYVAQHQQQLQPQHQQQQQQPPSAALCSSVVASPSTSMLFVEPLQHDAMSLLSLDDKLSGPDSGLGNFAAPDSPLVRTAPAATAFASSRINPHSLSPLRPLSQRLLPTAALGNDSNGSSGSGIANDRQGRVSAAVCSSPGDLIAAMLEGKKGSNSLHSKALLPAAAVLPSMSALKASGRGVSELLDQHKQQQQLASLIDSSELLRRPQPLCGSTPSLLQQPLLPLFSGSGSSSQLQQTTPVSAACSSNDATMLDLPRNGLLDCATLSPVQGYGSGGNGGSSSNNSGSASGSGGGNTSSHNDDLFGQLSTLMLRANAFPDSVQGVNAGSSVGRSPPQHVQELVQHFGQLPESSVLHLRKLLAAVDDSLNTAKAADAAVLAVAQVLAAKQQAAADAKEHVNRCTLHFRQALQQICPAGVAAAAAAAAAAGDQQIDSPCSTRMQLNQQEYKPPGSSAAVAGSSLSSPALFTTGDADSQQQANNDARFLSRSSRLDRMGSKSLSPHSSGQLQQGGSIGQLAVGSLAGLAAATTTGDAVFGVQGPGSQINTHVADELIRDPDDDLTEQQHANIAAQQHAAAAVTDDQQLQAGTAGVISNGSEELQQQGKKSGQLQELSSQVQNQLRGQVSRADTTGPICVGSAAPASHQAGDLSVLLLAYQQQLTNRHHATTTLASEAASVIFSPAAANPTAIALADAAAMPMDWLHNDSRAVVCYSSGDGSPGMVPNGVIGTGSGAAATSSAYPVHETAQVAA
eukprot:GHRR01001660.1.p1 GENE.GHRR01001660.1~~GHRR01001660.1.p1  ORF type:complete len:1310 (+),score=607.85 GHRR01001660.1:230-4159(+)